MGGINNFIQSFKKQRRLYKISKTLSRFMNISNLDSVLLLSTKKNEALDDLIELCLENDINLEFISKSEVNDVEDLKDIYNKLVLHGANQYVNGSLVCAACFVYPVTFGFILYHYKDNRFQVDNLDSYNSTLFVVNKLCDFFKTRKLEDLTD